MFFLPEVYELAWPFVTTACKSVCVRACVHMLGLRFRFTVWTWYLVKKNVNLQLMIIIIVCQLSFSSELKHVEGYFYFYFCSTCKSHQDDNPSHFRYDLCDVPFKWLWLICMPRLAIDCVGCGPICQPGFMSAGLLRVTTRNREQETQRHLSAGLSKELYFCPVLLFHNHICS